MTGQSKSSLLYFKSNLVKEVLISGVSCASKHKLLPNHQTISIALIVKLGGLVNTAAPYSNHVVIRVKSGFYDVVSILWCNSILKHVDWNKVCTLCENGHIVYFEVKMTFLWLHLICSTPPRIFMSFRFNFVLNKLCFTKAYVSYIRLRLRLKRFLRGTPILNLNLVQILLTISSWPPKFDVWEVYVSEVDHRWSSLIIWSCSCDIRAYLKSFC